MDKLLNCPFCGGEAFRQDGGGRCFIGCSSSTKECPVTPTVQSFGTAEAVDWWNTRIATLSGVGELVEALAGIKWRSDDKDNMEFAARITCFQMDKIRAALANFRPLPAPPEQQP